MGLMGDGLCLHCVKLANDDLKKNSVAFNGLSK